MLQGTGYKNGDHISFGITSKGRVWSFRRENISELLKWGKDWQVIFWTKSIDTPDLCRPSLLLNLNFIISLDNGLWRNDLYLYAFSWSFP